MFIKSFIYVLIAILFMNVGEAFSGKPERFEGLGFLKRVLRTPLKNDSEKNAIQSRRGIQQRRFPVRKFSPPQTANAKVQPRIISQRKAQPPVKRGMRVPSEHNRKVQYQTVKGDQGNKKVIQTNRKNRPDLPLKPSPKSAPKGPGQDRTVKVSDLPPEEKVRIQKILGPLNDKGTVTYRYPENWCISPY